MSLGAASVAEEVHMEELLTRSVASIQQQIKVIADALDLNPLEPRRNIDAIKELISLSESIEDDGELVRQLAIYAADGEEGRPLVARTILEMLDPKSKVAIAILAPYVNSENKTLRSFARDWFQSYDNGGPDKSPLRTVDFEGYADYVRETLRNGESIPSMFVLYLYERSPGRSLLIFNQSRREGNVTNRLEAMRRKLEADRRALAGGQQVAPGQMAAREKSNEVVLAEHIISNAIWLKDHQYLERYRQALPEATAELAKLAKHEQWWARLYVVEIAARHRELAPVGVLNKLSTDSNGIVAKRAKSSI